MKIVTIVGMIEDKKASYTYDDRLKEEFEELKKDFYTNMLPLLIDNFDCEIIPIFTEKAKNTQISVLKNEFGKDYSHIFDEKYLIKDDEDYYDILSLINDVIIENDEYIIDLTHGFRHLSILATIALITHSINNSSNIKHILFGKEIVQGSKYIIIDIKEYLELANISYMLTSFVKNYTVFQIGNFTDKSFQDLSDSLSNLSDNILSNSIQNIFDSSILDKTMKAIEETERENEKISTFKNSLDKIKEHIIELQSFGKIEKTSKRFFEFSKLLRSKGYLLNAITLLFEAIGCYCLESLKEIDDIVKKYEEGLSDHYKKTKKFRNAVAGFPNFNNGVKKNVQEKINNFLASKNIENFQRFIEDARNLRNNLTHGNNEEKVENAKKTFDELVKEYEKFCLDSNILGRI